jgi:hypothetical protein
MGVLVLSSLTEGLWRCLILAFDPIVSGDFTIELFLFSDDTQYYFTNSVQVRTIAG